MTLLFMMFVGFTSLFILWGLSYTSGAYTTLYGATQAAAYAAASQVDLGSGALGQPPFDCGSGWDSSTSASGPYPVCQTGRTFQAAQDLLASQFPCNGRVPYGLRYCADGSGNVQMGDGSHVSNGILAYEIAVAPGAALKADTSCSGFTVINAAESQQAQRTCWQNPYSAATVRAFNYSSGVVVVTTASIPFVPGCTSSRFLFCPQLLILTAVPASVGQQQPFTGTN
jgi:hypothetical protein